MNFCETYIRIQDFVDVIGSIGISRYHLVLKGLSDIGLGVFIGLYRIYTQNSGIEIDNIDYTRSEPISCAPATSPIEALDCLTTRHPNFCNCCAGYPYKRDNLMRIFKNHIKTHPRLVAFAIEKLL